MLDKAETKGKTTLALAMTLSHLTIKEVLLDIKEFHIHNKDRFRYKRLLNGSQSLINIHRLERESRK